MKAKENKIKYIKSYNKDNYQFIYLSLHKIKDKEMIQELLNAKSKTELVRDWYRYAKNK